MNTAELHSLCSDVCRWLGDPSGQNTPVVVVTSGPGWLGDPSGQNTPVVVTSGPGWLGDPNTPAVKDALDGAAERIAAAVVAGEVTLEEFLLSMSVQEKER